jgi:hypothetical protein
VIRTLRLTISYIFFSAASVATVCGQAYQGGVPCARLHVWEYGAHRIVSRTRCGQLGPVSLQGLSCGKGRPTIQS